MTNQFQIYVVTIPEIKWLAVTIDIGQSSTVLEVKLALQGIHGIQVDQIRLYHKMGMELLDGKTLKASLVVGGDTIHMLLSWMGFSDLRNSSMSFSDLRIMFEKAKEAKMQRKRTEEQRMAELAIVLIEDKAENIRMSSARELQEEKELLSVQGTLRDNWCASTSMTKSFVVVETDVYARIVIEELYQHFSREVAFDTEGLNLSRTGQMAVISLSLCQPSSVAFIFDLISIGRSIFSGTNSLKDLLESRIIKKITFDCRNDSNALYHQYGISLTNCLDLQVFQLGIKIENGSYSMFSADNPTYLRGLRYIAGGYLTRDEINFFSGNIPHKEDPEIRGTRPLFDIQWQYAANDVHLINRLLRGMRNLKLPLLLQERINIGSKRYTEVFRNANIDYQSDIEKYRHIIMGVEPI